MNRTNDRALGRILGRRTWVAMGALTLLGMVGAGSCSDNGTVATVSFAYDDPYVYTTYYPVDTSYAGYYWADSWNYYTFYYAAVGVTATGLSGSTGLGGAASLHGAAGANGAAGATGTGGVTGTGGAGGNGSTTVRATIASVIEALARGESVCPGQVTITPKTATPACAGSATEERNGVTLVFNACVVSGATINGTFDVLSNRAASEQTCSATTTITLGHTTTITNLSISDSNGKILIPSQTDTGMTVYTFGQTPTTTTFNITGEMQTFSTTGTMVADLSYTGMDTVTFSGGSSYSVDGTTTVQEKNGPASATINEQGVTRSNGCCRPTAGTVTIDRTGGPFPGTATWTFGPSCGAVMRNNVSAMLPACI
jgi:collagen type VII alpha